MVKRCAPTNVNSDRGFNSGRRRGNNPHPQIPSPQSTHQTCPLSAAHTALREAPQPQTVEPAEGPAGGGTAVVVSGGSLQELSPGVYGWRGAESLTSFRPGGSSNESKVVELMSKITGGDGHGIFLGVRGAAEDKVQLHPSCTHWHSTPSLSARAQPSYALSTLTRRCSRGTALRLS